MADEDLKEARETQSPIPKDWSSDYFPTSAKPVFVRVGLLAAVLVAICAAVYLTSEHPPDPEMLEKRKKAEATLFDPPEEDTANPQGARGSGGR